MLPFHGKLNSENPVSEELHLDQLKTWFWALALVGSNFFGYFATYYGYRINAYFVSASVLSATLVSILYHLCQTTDYCYLMHLAEWTWLDHITAPSMMATLVLFIATGRGIADLRKQHRIQQFELFDQRKFKPKKRMKSPNYTNLNPNPDFNPNTTFYSSNDTIPISSTSSSLPIKQQQQELSILPYTPDSREVTYHSPFLHNNTASQLWGMTNSNQPSQPQNHQYKNNPNASHSFSSPLPPQNTTLSSIFLR